jgi:DNA adenine methylase
MTTPISYYGGKQNMIQHLLPLIPEHKQYVEPFIGGASMFFAKKPSECEVINDYDLRVTNFWDCLQNDFEALQHKIRSTLHSEIEHHRAKDILKAGFKDNRLDFAWAFWVQTNMSFGKKIFAGFAFSNGSTEVDLCLNKKIHFTHELYQRMNKVQIFNRDAIDLIKLKDGKDTFFYFDPPYAESNCGHYESVKDVYYRLLEYLPNIKGKWLMSSYPSEQLDNLRALYFWNKKDIDKNLSVSGKDNAGKRKTECLTWNYNITNMQQSLF